MTGVLGVGTSFKKFLHAGLGALGFVQILLIITGKLLAVFPIAGLGEFIITAPDIKGSEFQQFPAWTIGHRVPTVMISMARVDMLHGFELTKVLDFSATPIGAIFPTVDVNITTNFLSVQGLVMEASGLESKRAEFRTFYAWQNHSFSNDNPTDSVFVLRAQNLDLEGATIHQDALRTNGLSLDLRSLHVSLLTVSPVGNPTYQ